MKTSYTVPIAIIIGGIIVAVAVYFVVAKPAPRTGSGTGNPALVRPVDTNDHILGNPTAQVMIIEYTDFDCPYCKDFSEILHQVVANAGANGKVAWVFRHFPLYELHPNATKHAQAAECVAKASGNDAFWKFEEALYKNQPVDPSQYGALAVNAGVQGDAFTTCYTTADAVVGNRIRADRQNALDTGAIGTPYSLIVIKGKAPVVIDSAYSYDAVMLLVDQALTPN